MQSKVTAQKQKDETNNKPSGRGQDLFGKGGPIIQPLEV